MWLLSSFIIKSSNWKPPKLPYAELLASDEASKNIFTEYKMDLNNRGCTWSQLDTETDIGVLSALLFEWMEHLKSPILGKYT